MNLRAENNFDFLRFSAASLVLLSHSFPLVYGEGGDEPLARLSHGKVSLGGVAVIIFFILSGFLISASWENKRKLSSFLKARIARIFPALVVMLMLTVLCGALLTRQDFSHYSASAASYYFWNIVLKGKAELADLFVANPYGPAVNGSLWTLRFEFVCYLVVAFFGMFDKLKQPWLWLLWGIVLMLSLLPVNNIPTYFLKHLFPLLIWFVAGMLAYSYRDQTFSKLWLWMIPVLAVLFYYFEISLTFVSPVIAYLLIRVLYLKSPLVNFGKYGDFSYGIYIYAFPIQQFIVFLMTKSLIHPMTWWMCTLLSLPLTLLCAIASWHCVEKHFVRSKKRSAVKSSIPADSAAYRVPMS